MCDYTADPLWDERTGAMVRLEHLPLSAELVGALRAFARRWDEQASEATASEEEPDERAWAWYEPAGRALCERVRSELGERFAVGWPVAGADSARWEVEWRPGGPTERPRWFADSDASP